MYKNKVKKYNPGKIFLSTKLFLLTTLTSLSFLPLISSTYAQSSECVKKNQLPSFFDPNCTGRTPTIGEIFANVISFIPAAISVVLFGVIIWGGVQVFSAGANDEVKKKGFKTLQNGITGIFILFFSITIITIIEAVIGQKILFGIFVNK